MENKYKAKYLELSNKQIGGTKTLNIVILHHPITKNTKIPKDMIMKPIIKKLSKLNIAMRQVCYERRMFRHKCRTTADNSF